MEITEEELQELYIWVDGIPLSRPKRNIARDFSDGVLTAEVVHHFYPRLVELHNYSAANSLAQKLYNWSTLNNRVFKRLGFVVPNSECEAVANCEAGAVERVLKLTRDRLVQFAAQGPRPSASRAITQEAYSPDDALDPYETDSRAQDGIAAHYPQQRPGTWDSQAGAGASRGPASAASARPDPRQDKAAPLGAGLSLLRLHEPLDKRAAAALAERDLTITTLRETNEILDIKVRKLEQLVRLKDAKLQKLSARLEALTTA